MSKKILTTHVGSLPRSPQLLEANDRRLAGDIGDEEFNEILRSAVDSVVKRQKDIGIDIVNEGEYGHIMLGSIDFGAWWNYSYSRFGGLTLTQDSSDADVAPARSEPGNIQLTSFFDRRDWSRFTDAYLDPASGILAGPNGPASHGSPHITGELTYVGQEAVQTDVGLLKTAMDANGIERGFMAAISPGSASRIPNKFYDSEKDLLNACADALAHEYKAITDAGLIVQLDAPDLAESWDQINPEPTVKDFQDWLQLRIDALNRALEGIDPELVRLHICWGSWHGPHTTDVPFDVIIDQCLQVNAGSFSFEGASARHAHEWKVWKDHPLPEGRLIVPGVVSHSTNIVEHPELVAERIMRFADVVGPENVIASTDCGLGGRVHGDIAWAKLESLVEGARIASDRLF